jgi:hypothetical protein
MNMSLLSRNSFLGVAIGQRSLAVAEVSASRGRWEVRRAAEFTAAATAEADTLLTRPAETGEALARFLRQNGFSASRVVIGVPARWVVARDKDLPPTDEQQAADILRLQAERLFSTELKGLTFDYAGTPDANSPTRVLLMAMPRERVEQVSALAQAAGLTVQGVMPSTLALASAPQEPRDTLLLNVGGDAVELAAQAGGSTRLLRHLPVRPPSLISQNGTRESAVGALASEIKRVVALVPREQGPGSVNGQAPTASPRTVVLWDGLGLDAAHADLLGETAGVTVEAQGDLAAMGLLAPAASETPAADPSRFAPAVALALAGARAAARESGRRQPLPVNFLSPRLAPPRRARVGRRTVWALIIGAVLLLTFGSLGYDLHKRHSELHDLRNELDSRGPEVKSVEVLDERVRSARGHFIGRPPLLECLRELTLAIPLNERLYVTNFNLRDNRKGTVAGRASDQKSVLALMDRLKASKKFTDVKLVNLQDPGGSSRELSFTLSYTFIGVWDNPATQPSGNNKDTR